MDLQISPEDIAFADEVRGFLKARLPDEIRDKCLRNARLTKDEQVRWQKILNERGWMAPSWPRN